MTDKQSFLERLSAELYERNISETDVRPYIEQFDRFYDRMANDPSAVRNVLENVESIADNIAAQISDKYDDINRLAERTMTVDAVKDDGEDDITVIDPEATMTTDISELSIMSDEYEPAEPGLEEPDDGLFFEDDGSDVGEEYIGESSRLPDYDEKEEIKASKMFWVLFAVSLPLTIPLLAAALGAFGAVWLGLAALLGCGIAGLVAVVGAGAAVSLVGIIYGIIQLFVSVPIGVYEIGIGVVVAGAAMLLGILLYNFAVRFVPLLMRLWWKLFLKTLDELKRLFDYLRKESVRL